MKRLLRELLNAPGLNDRVSSTYLWYHVGNIAATIVFIKAGLHMAASPTQNVEGLSILMLTYMGLITGNKLASKILENRMTPGQSSASTSEVTSMTTVTTQSNATPTGNNTNQGEVK